MSFDTISLGCFIAVAENGSFTKAADKIGRTQSAVSQQIAKLENLLGKELFNRSKNLSLTNEGEIFFSYAKQIYKLHNEVIDHFKEPELEGEVRFGLPDDFASVYLYDILAEFSNIHPRIHLDIECDLTLNLFQRFKKKEFDLVLVKMSRPEDFPNGIEVWSETLKWVGNQNLINLNDSIPLVLSPQPCVYRLRALKALNENGIKWRMALSSPSYASRIAAVKANMGITVLPKNMTPKDVPIIANNKNLPNLDDSHISLLKQNNENKALNSFEKFVIERLKP
jgi:DNA-binding transcriptional LysR family regulator